MNDKIEKIYEKFISSSSLLHDIQNEFETHGGYVKFKTYDNYFQIRGMIPGSFFEHTIYYKNKRDLYKLAANIVHAYDYLEYILNNNELLTDSFALQRQEDIGFIKKNIGSLLDKDNGLINNNEFIDLVAENFRDLLEDNEEMYKVLKRAIRQSIDGFNEKEGEEDGFYKLQGYY